eukprot:660324-Pyramimonas_sp.AAC.1
MDTVLSGTMWPSPATISRARLYLDVAWMLHMSGVHLGIVKHNGVLFPMFDSSPQGGRNWCLMEYTHISDDRPGHVFRIAHRTGALGNCSDDDLP